MTSESPPPTPWVWAMPLGPALLSGIGVVFCGAAAVAMLACAVIAARAMGLATGVFLLAMTLVIAFMTAFVWRDMRGKLGGRIEIAGEQISLSLPSGRSLIYDPPACRAAFPLSEIGAVETRLVALSNLTAANMQRAYRLVKRDGSAIFLFEDRALGTVLANASHQAVAAEIARRAGVQVNDLGMARGSAGILGVAFVRAPSWADAALPEISQAGMWRRARLTGLIALLAVVITFLLFVFL